MSIHVDAARRDCAISVLGGPTTVIDIAGRRIVMDDYARTRLLSD